MLKLKYLAQYFGSKNFFTRILKPTIVPVFIVYVFLQMTITAHTSGIYFHISRNSRHSIEKQPVQEKSTVVSFVTKPFNDSIPEDVYLRLTRAVPKRASNSFQTTCSSRVRLLRGYPRRAKGFLTLGLSTVPRENAFYLPEALDSLLSKMTDLDKNDSVIVIFLGSQDSDWVNGTLSELDAKFTEYISSGLIQVIQPEESIYPNFTKITKRNFNDAPIRVHWRTKQNIDYAYLFAYCEKLSEYYIHVEDDVTAANGYVNEIRTFVANTEKLKQTWFLLEFSSLGFIGKLFRSSDLCTMKDYFLLFKDEKPCDLLINDLKRIKTQIRDYRSPKSLFQHFGVSSSLKGKIQKLTDRNFKDLAKRPSLPNPPSPPKDLSTNFKRNTIPNPPARVFTSMQAYGAFSRYLPYSVGQGGYFWTRPPHVNDYYRINFKSQINISFVHIQTGHPQLKTYMLQNAAVKVGSRVNGTQCQNVHDFGTFQQGEFFKKLNKTLQISCLEILVTKPQRTWMIINEINIKSYFGDVHSNRNETKKAKIPVHKEGKDKGTPSGPSQCEKWWKCKTCFKVVNTEKRKIEDHQCGERYCSSCQHFVLEDHLAIPAEEDFKPKFIFLDFECTQDQILECQEGYAASKKPDCSDCQPDKMCKSCSRCRHCKTSWCGKATHRPNFVVAQSVCPACIDKLLTPDSVCRKCGTRCEECDDTDLEPCNEKCGFREVVFECEDTAEWFGEWLFSDQHRHFKAVAHNMKGYDGYFLLEYLIDQSVRPDKIIYNGSKITYMTVEKDLHIKVIDSLNFLPMKLADLPKAFDLEELKKGWFPHYFNTKQDQNYVGPYPEAKYYGHDFMSEEDREKFLEWLSEKESDMFDFRKDMLAYCRSDVDILRLV